MAKVRINQKLRELSEQVYIGAKSGQPLVFEGVKGDDALRNAIAEVTTDESGNFDYYTFMANKYKTYAILADVLALPVARELEGSYINGVVEFEDLLLGDKKEWKIEDLELFDVYKVAAGHNDIARQRIQKDRKITCETEYFGIKIYAEFEEFRAGRVDFVSMVQKVAKSFEKHVASTIYKIMADSYSRLTADKFAVTGTFASDKLVALLQRLEAKTGLSYGVYGTLGAISKIGKDELETLSEEKKTEIGRIGYNKQFRGRDVIEIPQVIDKEDNFVLSDDVLMVLPTNLKLIKVVFEGDPLIKDSFEDGTHLDSTDEQLEFTFRRKMGVAMLIANYHGIYDMSK